MDTILVLADDSCQLQNDVSENVKLLILADHVGSHFEEVDTWDETLKHPTWDNGTVVEDTDRLNKEAIEYVIHTGEAIVNEHIQEPITKYNEENMTNFGGIHNCANYKDTEGYTHQAFCLAVWNFNVEVWEKARQLESAILSGAIAQPTEEEFKNLLPVFSFDG